jgi:hypothetical protein
MRVSCRRQTRRQTFRDGIRYQMMTRGKARSECPKTPMTHRTAAKDMTICGCSFTLSFRYCQLTPGATCELSQLLSPATVISCSMTQQGC